MSLRCWRQLAVALSGELHEAVQELRRREEKDWFSLAHLINQLPEGELRQECLTLRDRHGNFSFRFTED